MSKRVYTPVVQLRHPYCTIKQFVQLTDTRLRFSQFYCTICCYCGRQGSGKVVINKTRTLD